MDERVWIREYGYKSVYERVLMRSVIKIVLMGSMVRVWI